MQFKLFTIAVSLGFLWKWPALERNYTQLESELVHECTRFALQRASKNIRCVIAFLIFMTAEQTINHVKKCQPHVPMLILQLNKTLTNAG